MVVTPADPQPRAASGAASAARCWLDRHDAALWTIATAVERWQWLVFAALLVLFTWGQR
ncbi:MAG: hypothetical protein ACRDQ7_09300 [Haloechinothrix sp.]